MSTANQPLLQELESLGRELDRFQEENRSLTIQNQILKNFVSLVSTSAGWLLVKATLQKTLEAAIQQTNAQQGSLFLLDDQGNITECVLARGATTKTKRDAIVGQVLDKGLAGWVRENRKTGLVEDTLRDFRWLKLDDEPYEARSALGVPIFWGGIVLGVLTLMHPSPQHFTPATASLMERTTELIALVLNTARIFTERKQVEDDLRKREQMLSQIVTHFPNIIWIMDSNGIFVLCGGQGLESFGLDPIQAISQSVFSLYADVPQLLAPIRSALEGNTLQSVVFKHEGVVYDSWYSPIMNPQGRVLRVLCVIADVSKSSKSRVPHD